MDLLEFASGPALDIALVIFITGVVWRLGYLLMLKKRVDKSESRGANERLGGLWMIASRSINHGPLSDEIKAPIANAYLMHLLLFVVIFAAEEHILLLEENFGISWISMPPDALRIVTYLLLASLAISVYRRLRHPVLKLLSNFDDWFSLIITALVVVTGLIAGLTEEASDNLVAVHVLSFDLLLIWFPFGKLMHMFLIFGSRYSTGIAFAHKGARL